MSRICQECGEKNLKTAAFCQKCGNNLQDEKTKPVEGTKNELRDIAHETKAFEKELRNNIYDIRDGVIGGFRKWWSRRDTKGKTATMCCLGVFLFVVIAGILGSGITALTLENSNIQIDDKTTDLIIKGTSEPNATVNVTAADLNITNIKVDVDPNGKFEYKLKIPIEVTETKITVNAQVNDKYSNFREVTIQRPVTPLTVNQPPEINNETQNITLEGDSDPQTVITINSNELNIKDLTIRPDSNGHYKQVIQVPLNITGAAISVTAISPGKRKSNVLTVNIKRVAPQPPSQPPATQPAQDTTQNTGTSSNGDSSSSSNSKSSKSYGSYIANCNPSGDHVFHYSWCSYVKKMNEENKVPFSSREDAINAGYRPCKRCNP